jgi:glutamyl-tRNA reductase
VAERTADRTILCVGTSHRLAPVDILERAVRHANTLRVSFEEAVRAGRQFQPPLAELVVLATCNRVELYVVCDEVQDGVAGALRAALGCGEPQIDARLYTLKGRDAVRHLCRVAAGIDSLVVGEPQIAGQVARAFASVIHVNGGAPQLAAAARTAKIASRRARAETAIARRPASISSLAVHIAAEMRGGLEGARVLIVGAGKIGRLASEALRESGASVTIINRTLARAETLAARVGAQASPLAALPELLGGCDVAITSTASPVPIIDAALLRTVRVVNAPLDIIDIAVPRNVADDVRTVPGVRLAGIDDLRDRIAAHLGERRDEVPLVESIIDEVVDTFEPARSAASPLIADLRRRAENIRHRELERALRAMEPLDVDARQRIEHLTRVLVNRLLHDPTARLRAASEHGRVADYEPVVRELFALDDAP